MKRINFLIISFFFVWNGYAQAPEKMSYQAVIRGSNSVLLVNKQIGIRISIIQSTAFGTPVYVETQGPTSNENGLISIQIGSGTIQSGSMSAINWMDGPYFVKTEVDPDGAANYTINGTSQILSVPFALLAKNAENLIGPLNETDPLFKSSIAAKITSADTAFWNHKLNTFLEGDPVFTQSLASRITSLDTSRWNGKLNAYTESDPFFNSSLSKNITAMDTIRWNNKLSSYTETDPLFNASLSKNILAADTFRWNHKLSSYTETDPLFNASLSKNITATDTIRWNSKLSSFTEADPLFNVSLSKNITAADTIRWNSKLSSYTESDPLFNVSLSKNILAADTFRWNHKLSSYTETDPLFNVSLSKNITAADTIRWNSKLGSFTETDPLFNTSLSKNITAADTIRWNSKLGSFTETDPLFNTSLSKNILEADTFRWNHKLSSYTETDPLFNVSLSKNITSADTIRWNSKLGSYTETDPLFNVSLSKNITSADTIRWNNKLSSYSETDPLFNVSLSKNILAADTFRWNHKLSSYVETDPLFNVSLSKNITATDTIRWNNKLSSFTESDPLFNVSLSKNILAADTFRWNHKLSSYVETDPLFNVSLSKNITATDTLRWNSKLSSYTETDPLFNVSLSKNITASDTLRWNHKLSVEKDSSVANELQYLSLNNDTILLSNGGSIRLPITIKNATINQDSLYLTYTNNQVVNAGYVGNGSPGSMLPTLQTDSFNSLKYNTAMVYGKILNKGNELVIGKGICYATSNYPNLANSYVLAAMDGSSAIIGTLNNLLPATTYYARAFVTNTVGTAYGNQISFTTWPLTFPTLLTKAIFNVSFNTAIANVSITDNGGSNITESGICWSTSSNPTTANSKALSGTSSDTFNVMLTGLTANTTYYARAYAINAQGTSYGNQLSFITPALTLATVSTNAITSVSYSTAFSGGNVSADNGSSITGRGICWSISTLPTLSNSNATQTAGLGSYSIQMTGLSPNTTYYVRAFANNGAGTAYGNQLSFTTSALSAPLLSTKAISGISSNIAGSGGDISSDGGSNITAKGVVWSLNINPTLSNYFTNDGSGSASFNSTMTGLAPLTTYYVKAYATNTLGTTYGNQFSFTTTSLVSPGPLPPTLGTSPSAMVSSTTAGSGGYISSDGGSTVSNRGVCWSTLQNPTLADNHSSNGTGVGFFTSTLTGLSGCGTVYYVRAFATNSTGTGYGNQVTVTTGMPAIAITAEITNITTNSATSGVSVLDSGNCPITQKGICWYWSSGPTLAHFKTALGPGAGTFASNITGLMSNRTYYVRSYVTNSKGTTYGTEKSFITATPSSLYIGQSYAGGIIFYLDSTGQHGMVCATSDQGNTVWGCKGTFIGGTSTAMGTGAGNTAAIVAGCSQTGIPAKVCDDLVLNSYSDWYLPSSAELMLLQSTIYLTGLGNFTNNTSYWTSSDGDASNAYLVDFYVGSGTYSYPNAKDYPLRFRAVRSF